MGVSILGAALVAAVGLLAIPKGSRALYRTPKETLLILGAVALAGAWLMLSREVRLEHGLFEIVLLLGMWQAFSSFFSINRDRARRKLMITISAMATGVIFSQGVNQIAAYSILCAAAAINAIDSLAWQYLGFKKFSGIDCRAGALGNTNFLGAYLAPHAVLALYLSLHSHFLWFGACAIICAGVIRSRCRGAMSGMAAGLLLYSAAEMGLSGALVFLGAFILLAVCVIVVKAPFDRCTGYRFKDLIDKGRVTAGVSARINYFRMALMQIADRPIFGVGIDCARARIPFLQRSLAARLKNRKGVDLFCGGNEGKYNPRPALFHNDFLQIAVDCGLPALFLSLFIAGYAIFIGFSNEIAGLPAAQGTGAAQAGGPPAPIGGAAAACGVLAMIVSGLVMHPQSITATLSIYWFLIGSAGQTASMSVVWAPGALEIAAIAFLGMSAIFVAVPWQRRDLLLYRYFSTNGTDTKSLQRAWEMDPYGTLTNNLICRHTANHQKDPMGAFFHAIRAVERFDGEQPLWSLWANVGNLSAMLGSAGLAKTAFETALSFYPHYEPARAGLMRIHQAMDPGGLTIAGLPAAQGTGAAQAGGPHTAGGPLIAGGPPAPPANNEIEKEAA